jgi:hypothetical protein
VSLRREWVISRVKEITKIQEVENNELDRRSEKAAGE